MNRTILAAAALVFLAGAPAAYAQAAGAGTAGKPAPAKPSTPMNAKSSPAASTDCAKLTEAKARQECMTGAGMHKKM
ncbi:MAG TPA: hypothetical protein P5256_01390 [Beijerinckiaceae bacterium]|nr:hypothetical protein [Methylobacteriaceae bacterium]MCO5086535.1 hypothetical protein [Methylobacteriaceae bacterium]HPG03843.1 hypothetical protein [Rhodoblastus sp.]HRY01750.1 hypothetical protein [Beijerinckiaceae bacterium]